MFSRRALKDRRAGMWLPLRGVTHTGPIETPEHRSVKPLRGIDGQGPAPKRSERPAATIAGMEERKNEKEPHALVSSIQSPLGTTTTIQMFTKIARGWPEKNGTATAHPRTGGGERRYVRLAAPHRQETKNPAPGWTRVSSSRVGDCSKEPKVISAARSSGPARRGGTR